MLVGDMDGSGSRGVTWLLRAGGVWMRTTNEWLDWAKDEHPLSNVLVEKTHSMDYEVPPSARPPPCFCMPQSARSARPPARLAAKGGCGALSMAPTEGPCSRLRVGRCEEAARRPPLAELCTPSVAPPRAGVHTLSCAARLVQVSQLPTSVKERAERQVRGVLREFSAVAQSVLGERVPHTHTHSPVSASLVARE